MTFHIAPFRGGALRGTPRAVLIGVLALTASGCYDDGGVVTGTLETQALRADDLSPAPAFPEDACAQFPILPGARREVTYPIDADLKLDLSLTADDVTAQLGGETSFERTYSREELLDGVRIRATSTAAEYFVSLREGCE